MGFNLLNIRDVPNAEVEIKDDTGAATGAFFDMAGPTHPKAKSIAFDQNRKNIARFQKAGKVELPDPEEAELTNRDNLVARTLGWRGFVDEAGAERPFSKKAVAELYAQPDMQWLVDQLQTALGERERFIKRLPTA
jgi:hypothetical protein